MLTWETESRDRCVILADYLLENRATVRRTAQAYGISKSTVHKDLTEKLPRIDPDRFTRVKELLDLNKAERHLRGGEATRRKYQMTKKSCRKRQKE